MHGVQKSVFPSSIGVQTLTSIECFEGKEICAKAKAEADLREREFARAKTGIGKCERG